MDKYKSFRDYKESYNSFNKNKKKNVNRINPKLTGNYLQKYLTDEQKEAIGKKRNPRKPRDVRRRKSMNKSREEQEFYNIHGYLP